MACDRYEERFPEEAIAAVKEWHVHTYWEDFLSKFPDALKTADDYPKDEITSKTIPACSLYPEIKDKCTECSDCRICWNRKKRDEKRDETKQKRK